MDLQVRESFIEFQTVSDHTARGLEVMVKIFLEKIKIDFSKCRGQAYGGASVISCAYNGLQARLQKIEKNAKYVHCAAHKLNLVLTYSKRFYNSICCNSNFGGYINVHYKAQTF